MREKERTTAEELAKLHASPEYQAMLRRKQNEADWNWQKRPRENLDHELDEPSYVASDGEARRHTRIGRPQRRGDSLADIDPLFIIIGFMIGLIILIVWMT